MADRIQIRRVFKAGNSLVVAVPKKLLEAVGLEEGSPVTFEVPEEKREIVIKPLQLREELPRERQFALLVEDFIDKYEGLLRELAK